MTVVMMRDKASQMKELVEQGLHIFGKVMNMCEQMCDESEMGERGGRYGSYGQRDMDYPYGDRYGMREDYPMGEKHYPMSPMWDGYGERRGVRGTGRYSRY